MKKLKLKDNGVKRIIILVLIIILVISIPTLGKFISKKFHEFYLNSKHFYFYSNRLKEDNPLYQVNNWSGVGSFEIEFDLSSEKNRYTYADYDIEYELSVECSDTVNCELSEEDGVLYSTNPNHQNTITVSVTPDNVSFEEGDSVTIEITAQSTSPYKKTISATFEYIVGKSGVTYEIDDEPGRSYIILTLTNAISYCTVVEDFGDYEVGDRIDRDVFVTLNSNDRKKCKSQIINLSIPTGYVIVDNTSSIFDIATYSAPSGGPIIGGIRYINKMEFWIDPSSALAIRFYKRDVDEDYTYPFGNYENSIITVTISDPDRDRG